MSAVRVAAPPAPARAATCPYRGLLPFSEADARYFFGRDADRELIAANLIAARLTLLYAPSGVGKTSVLLAGVAHDLRLRARDGAVEGRGPEYLPVVVRRWSGDPRAAIEAALAEGAERVLGAVPEHLPRDVPLVDLLRAWADATDTTILLVLDQFEEFLLYHGASWEPGGAAREIARALSARDLPANFLLGLREDALASLDRFKGRVPYLFDNYLRLAHLDADAAREAVRRPLEQWSADHPEDPMEIEPELVETLLDEVTTGRIVLGRAGGGAVAAGGRAGVETPFLQLVLTRLWEEERRRGSRCMRVATLRALGGADEMVRTHLDVRMSALTRHQRDIAAAVFHQLVTPSGTKVARSLDDLAAYTGVPAAQIEPVLRTLSDGDWRIVRSVAEPAGTFEVFHDVLAEAILDWRARHEEQRRRARTVRKAAVTALCAVLIAGLALLFAAWVASQKQEADRQRDLAEQATLGATSRALAAASQLQYGLDPEGAVDTAVRAVDSAGTPEAMLALRGALAQNDLRGTLPGEPGSVRSLRVSLDGRRLAIVGADHRVRVWTPSEGRRPVTLPRTAGLAESVALSPGGGRVAAGGRSRITVWSLAGPRQQHLLAYPGKRLQSIRWSPDGARLLSFGPGGVRVWDAAKGRVVEDVPDAVLGEWSAGGTRFATATRGGAVRVWSAGGRQLGALDAGGPVRTLGFTGDASRVVAVGRDGAVTILGGRGCRASGARVTVAAVARDGRSVALGGGPSVRILTLGAGDRCRQTELPNPQRSQAVAVTLAPDGSVAVVATDDGIARVYDIRRRTLLATLFAGWRQQARLAMRAGAGGGQLIFTAGDDGLVRQWEIGALPLAERFGDARVQAAAIRADGRLVGAAGGRLLSTRWERAGGARRAGAVPGATAVVFDGEGERLAYTTAGGDLLVREPGGETRRMGDRGDGRDVTGLGFGADGRSVVTALRSGAVRVWDAATGELARRIPAPAQTTGRAYAAVEAGGAVIVADGDVRIHAPGAAEPRILERELPVAEAAAGGTPVAVDAPRRLAVAFDRAGPRSWRDHERTPAVVLDRAGRLVGSVAFSPGGDVIATAGRNGVRLLDPATGQTHALLSAGAFDRVAFSPDGQWVVATGHRSGVQVFRCRPCGELAQLLARAERVGSLAPVAPLDVPADRPLVQPPPASAPDAPDAPAPPAAPQAPALVVPTLPPAPVIPTTPAPVPPPTLNDGSGGGGGGGPTTGGGGED